MPLLLLHVFSCFWKYLTLISKCKKSKYVKYPLTDFLILHNMITQTRSNKNKPTFSLCSYNHNALDMCKVNVAVFIQFSCVSYAILISCVSLVTTDTVQICLLTILLNTVAIELQCPISQQYPLKGTSICSSSAWDVHSQTT